MHSLGEEASLHGISIQYAGIRMQINVGIWSNADTVGSVVPISPPVATQGTISYRGLLCSAGLPHYLQIRTGPELSIGY